MSIFRIFDVVQVVAADAGLMEIDRKFGIILGSSKDNDGVYHYSVSIYGDDNLTAMIDNYFLHESSLVYTGRSVSSDFVYGGTKIAVTKNGQQA
jgi:hypothetical protein